jgi:hypothetical protein
MKKSEAQAIWETFMNHESLLVNGKPPVNFLGSIAKYQEIFIQAQTQAKETRPG